MLTIHHLDRHKLNAPPVENRSFLDHNFDDPHGEMKFFLAIASVLACGAALLAAETPVHLVTNTGQAVSVVSNSILSDGQLRMFCLAGAFAGAFVSIALYPLKSAMEGARKGVVSIFSGGFLTPILMHWWHMDFTADYVFSVSGAVALLSWGVLQTALPLLDNTFASWVNNWFKAKTGQ